MKSKEFFACFFLVLLVVSGCTLFGSSDSTDELGWERVSLPKNLKGVWYLRSYQYLEVTSKSVIVDNREWVFDTIARKNDEYRILGKSEIQYRSIYFRNLTESSVEKALGEIVYEKYDAKIADREDWTELYKKPSE